MTRRWSIRVRTALAFALASMVLTTAVLVFVNVSALGAIERSVILSPDDTSAPAGGGPGDDVAVVTVVMTQQWQWSVIGIAASGVVAGGLGWFISRRMLRPLDRIAAAADQISASTLHDRIPLVGPNDEVRRLARTFNDLVARLEAAFESQRRFVAQASHELRTPLAVQRAAIQIGLHDHVDREELVATREQLLDQNRASAHLVESLLTLAEADRGLDGSVEPVDLAGTARLVSEGLSAAASATEVTVAVEQAVDLSDGTVLAEPILLRQVLANLVENGIEYNEPGGWVKIHVSATGFLVESTGATIPAEIVATLTEPFTRATESRGLRRHSGLGLSIVAAVVSAHGWTLALRPRTGGGLVVDVRVSPVQPGG